MFDSSLARKYRTVIITLSKMGDSSSDWDSGPELVVKPSPDMEKSKLDFSTIPAPQYQKSIVTPRLNESPIPPMEYPEPVVSKPSTETKIHKKKRGKRATNASRRKANPDAGKQNREETFSDLAKHEVVPGPGESPITAQTSQHYTTSPEGIDNRAFEAEKYVVEEKPENDSRRSIPSRKQPIPDEKITIYEFQQLSPGFITVEHPRSRPTQVWADSWSDRLSSCFSWGLAQVFGVLKIPFVLLIVLIGQLTMFLIDGVVQPISDFILKPLAASVHNAFCVPGCAIFLNCCQLFARGLQPMCEICSRREDKPTRLATP